MKLDLKDIEGLKIEGRPAQLSQVILNLISNAVDAIMHQPEKWVELKITLQNEMIIFSVTDSGNGIPKEVAEKIMQPFFTTKEIGKGTGLGLSISKGIVEDHQGKFYYDENCKNTRFCVEIPIIQAKAI